MMLRACLLAAAVAASAAQDVITTNAGEPIHNYKNSETIGQRGPILLQDAWVIERLQTHNRERIPERIVHARGATAFGEFTLTKDFSHATTADVFTGVGKVTPLACRWSTVIHGVHSPEYLRDPRGFALKFYTQQGNYDIVGLNFPVFFIRDGIRFPDMIRSLRPNPVNGVQEWWRIWDFFSNYRESIHMWTWLLDDVGIPRSYREVDGFGVHTYKWINAAGESTLVRYYWESEQGVHSMDSDGEAARQHFSFHTIDLYEKIAAGDFPKWKLYVQRIPENNTALIASLPFDPLDTTKEWTADLIPMEEVGEMVFNANVKSQFLENEMIAFSPARMVPGIVPSDEKMLQTRLFSYADTQRYRVGTNNQMLPVNRPRCPFRDGHIDGAMNFNSGPGNLNTEPANYFPSAEHPNVREFPDGVTDPQEYCDKKVREPLPMFDDFLQGRQRYQSWDNERKVRFAKRLAAAYSDRRLQAEVRDTWLGWWTELDEGLGQTVRHGIDLIQGGAGTEEARREMLQFLEDFMASSGGHPDPGDASPTSTPSASPSASTSRDPDQSPVATPSTTSSPAETPSGMATPSATASEQAASSGASNGPAILVGISVGVVVVGAIIVSLWERRKYRALRTGLKTQMLASRVHPE